MINRKEEMISIHNIIPKNFLSDLINFINERKYGTFSLVIQNGKVVGCDILEKKRAL